MSTKLSAFFDQKPKKKTFKSANVLKILETADEKTHNETENNKTQQSVINTSVVPEVSTNNLDEEWGDKDYTIQIPVGSDLSSTVSSKVGVITSADTKNKKEDEKKSMKWKDGSMEKQMEEEKKKLALEKAKKEEEARIIEENLNAEQVKQIWQPGRLRRRANHFVHNINLEDDPDLDTAVKIAQNKLKKTANNTSNNNKSKNNNNSSASDDKNNHEKLENSDEKLEKSDEKLEKSDKNIQNIQEKTLLWVLQEIQLDLNNEKLITSNKSFIPDETHQNKYTKRKKPVFTVTAC